MIETTNKYFNVLKRIAEDIEPVSRMRLAACLVYKNEVISIGTNKRKTHPFQRKFGKNSESIFLHAEIDCIINALKRVDKTVLEKSTLYVQRVKKKNSDSIHFINGMAKPCIGCQKAIAQFKIKEVFYTVDEKGFEEL